MQSEGEVMVQRAAGRGQQMSERKGGMWLLVRKKEVSNEMIYRANTLEFVLCSFLKEIYNLLNRYNEMIYQVSYQ